MMPRQVTGRHVLLWMVLFFGVVVSANLTMAFFATESWTGLVVKNSYDASQLFNEDLDRAEGVEIDSGSGPAHFMIKDPDGRTLLFDQF